MHLFVCLWLSSLLLSLSVHGVFCLSRVEGPLADIIPGSQVKTKPGASALRGDIICHRKEGHWVLNTTARKLPWIVRSYYASDQNVCDGEGRRLVKRMEGQMADRVAAEHPASWNVSPNLLWKWKGEPCRWNDFSYTGFCRAMAAARPMGEGPQPHLVIIGGEVGFALERRLLYNMLASRPNPLSPAVQIYPWGCASEEIDLAGTRHCSGYRYCYDVLQGRSVDVTYKRATSLANLLTKDSLVEWLEEGLDVNPTAIVVNHQDEDEKGIAEFDRNLRSFLQLLRKQYPDALLIYVSTPQASFCHPLTEPLWIPPTMPSATIDLQNSAAQKLVEEFGGLYLDLNPTTARMPAHMLNMPGLGTSAFTGCVDLCNPGIADAWVQLLYNTLLAALPKVCEPPQHVPTHINWRELQGSSFDGGLGHHTWGATVVNEASLPAPVLTSPIPGAPTRVGNEEQAERVQRILDCFAKTGTWVKGNTPRANATADTGDTAVWNVLDSNKYEWRSSTCSLERFSPDTFCRALGSRRSFLFVGDSLNRHFFSALSDAFKNASKEAYKGLYPKGMRELSIVHVHSLSDTVRGFSACQDILGEPVTFRFVASGYVYPNLLPRPGYIPWVPKLMEWKPEVVLLNRGAHYREDGVLLTELRGSLQHLRRVLPDALIIYRSTSPGKSNDSHPLVRHWTDHPPAILLSWRNDSERCSMGNQCLGGCATKGHAGARREGKWQQEVEDIVRHQHEERFDGRVTGARRESSKGDGWAGRGRRKGYIPDFSH